MSDTESKVEYKEWAHSPSHLFIGEMTYIVSGGTYTKAHFFRPPERLDFLQALLLKTLEKWKWRVHAWSVFSNHYHFVANAPNDAATLKLLIRELHSKSAIWVNKLDGTPGRKIWHQYWDTCLTFEKSYLARMNYVLQNPVKHGLVQNSEEYPWCSMRSFVQTGTPSFCKTVFSFKTDAVDVYDDF